MWHMRTRAALRVLRSATRLDESVAVCQIANENRPAKRRQGGVIKNAPDAETVNFLG
jgi:hypothetical protein